MRSAETVSESVRMLAGREPISLTALASVAGITKQTFFRRLNEHDWTVDEVDRLAEHFKVASSVLLDGFTPATPAERAS
jgi:hypothetical protein